MAPAAVVATSRYLAAVGAPGLFRRRAPNVPGHAAGGAPSRLGAFVVLGVIAFSSFAFSLWLTQADQPWAFFSLPSRAWELAAGGLVALGAPVLATGARRSRGGRRMGRPGRSCRFGHDIYFPHLRSRDRRGGACPGDGRHLGRRVDCRPVGARWPVGQGPVRFIGVHFVLVVPLALAGARDCPLRDRPVSFPKGLAVALATASGLLAWVTLPHH